MVGCVKWSCYVISQLALTVIMMTAEEKISNFLKQYGFAATFVGEATDFPREILLAHAALETGWGLHLEGNNLYGIKNLPFSWGTKNLETSEYFDEWVRRAEAFQTFPSEIHSMLAYVWKIRNQERYLMAWNSRFVPEIYFRKLQEAGYATDPEFADKLIGVYKRIREVLK